MSLDLNSKSACIFGLPDSGKSTLASYIASTFGSQCIVYDTLGEYANDPFDRYVPNNRQDVAELEKFTRRVMSLQRYHLYVIDETNRFCPSKPSPLPQAIADLNDWRAHYELATIYIARRPVQLNQDLTDLAHFLILFSLSGKHDIDYLNDIASGLGDAVEQLPPYHFIVAPPRRQDFAEYEPIPAVHVTHKVMQRQAGNVGLRQGVENPE